MAESSVPSGEGRKRPNGPRSSTSGAAASRRGDRPAGGSRDRRPARDERSSADRGERKAWSSRDDRAGERSERSERSDRTDRTARGERKPWSSREGRQGQNSGRSGQGERKSWGARDGRPNEHTDRGERGDRGERKPWSTRDGRPGERSNRSERDGRGAARSGSKPWLDSSGAPARKRAGGPRDDGDRGPRREYSNDTPRHNDPVLPDSIQARDLDKGAYVQLKGLSKENAERVARYLVATALTLESDPALAHTYALAAARTAGRIAVVRETVAITAYETGDFALALRELRTYRRISGNNDHIALIVDSERGLGRPEKGLEEGRAVDRASLPTESRVALAIAMSGARLDLGQLELALGELEIPELDPNRAFDYSPMLFHAYAEVLSELGRAQDSAQWRHRAEVAQAALDEKYHDDIIEVIDEFDDGAERDAPPVARTLPGEGEGDDVNGADASGTGA